MQKPCRPLCRISLPEAKNLNPPFLPGVSKQSIPQEEKTQDMLLGRGGFCHMED